MSKVTPKKFFNVEFTRQQLQLISHLVDIELRYHEAGFSDNNPNLLKQTFSQVHDLLKPSPHVERRLIQDWASKIHQPHIGGHSHV